MVRKSQNISVSYNLMFCFGAAVILGLTALNLSRFSSSEKVLGISTEYKNKDDEVRFWENIITHHPSYRDGWLNLAKIELYKGNRDYALAWFENAQKIDPNAYSVVELKKELGL